MKSKFTVLSFLIVLLTTSYTSFSQNKTNETAEIKSIISKKRSFNSTYGFGYRIQLYNGNESKARSIIARFKVEFPENFSKLVYKAPDWKVHVGNYKTKLEADKDIVKFQEKFSGIIVIPMGK
ncbi:SPOR domain-containing protein [Polaribacter sp. Z014]|uniref:SPOR domain-containing protein n=1 Tax=unclassified Polaribacter TaxID=196858 RepID=UPI00193B0C63|nr:MULTISPECIES: SPOR domain-containing protein [unclassified Polaribacter]MCL7761940.1 SPOR domain-containing protein [Polaribacter sp. Z014]QVY64671.1 SPOR domain-containing protein [Polaribacter sp. Q13]